MGNLVLLAESLQEGPTELFNFDDRTKLLEFTTLSDNQWLQELVYLNHPSKAAFLNFIHKVIRHGARMLGRKSQKRIF